MSFCMRRTTPLIKPSKRLRAGISIRPQISEIAWQAGVFPIANYLSWSPLLPALARSMYLRD